MSNHSLSHTLFLLCVWLVQTKSSSSSSSDSDSDSDESIPTAAPTVSDCPLIHSTAASHFYEGPIEITNDNLVDTITMFDIAIITFDLQIDAGFVCPDGWCHILQIGYQNDVGGGDSTRFPRITLTDDNRLRINVRDDDGNNAYNVENATIWDKIVNGSWNQFVWVQQQCCRDLFLNGQNILSESGPFNTSSVVDTTGTEMDLLVAGDNEYTLVPGSIRDLCIQTVDHGTIWADTTLAPMAFAAGSNIRKVEGEWSILDEAEKSHSEFTSGSGSGSGSETQTVEKIVSVTVSTSSWINLWGIIVVILLFNVLLGTWCMRKDKMVEEVDMKSNVMRFADSS